MEDWLFKTTREYTDLYPAAPPLEKSHELPTITHYIKNITSHSALTTIEPPDMWLYYATEYMPPASLLHIIRHRAPEYHPYVWDTEHCTYIAEKEAAAVDKYIDQYDWQAFLTRHREVRDKRANFAGEQPSASSSSPPAPAP